MDSLTEYVTTWFHTREFFPYFSGGARANAAWLGEEESGRPGFTARLQSVALQYLSSGTPDEKVRALRILAVTASQTDLSHLEHLTAHEQGPVQTEARRALRRIRWRHSPVPRLLIGIAVVILLAGIILEMLSR